MFDVGCFKKGKKVTWWFPPYSVLKFNVDGAAHGKLGRRALEVLLEITKERCCIFFLYT